MKAPPLKAVTGGKTIDKPGHLRERKVDGSPTLLTGEMVVIGAIAEMYYPRSGAEVSVVEKPQPFEGVNGAVYGRLVNGGAAVAGGGVPNLDGGEMVIVRAGQDFTNGPPGGGEAQTLGLERPT